MVKKITKLRLKLISAVTAAAIIMVSAICGPMMGRAGAIIVSQEEGSENAMMKRMWAEAVLSCIDVSTVTGQSFLNNSTSVGSSLDTILTNPSNTTAMSDKWKILDESGTVNCSTAIKKLAGVSTVNTTLLSADFLKDVYWHPPASTDGKISCSYHIMNKDGSGLIHENGNENKRFFFPQGCYNSDCTIDGREDQKVYVHYGNGVFYGFINEDGSAATKTGVFDPTKTASNLIGGSFKWDLEDGNEKTTGTEALNICRHIISKAVDSDGNSLLYLDSGTPFGVAKNKFKVWRKASGDNNQSGAGHTLIQYYTYKEDSENGLVLTDDAELQLSRNIRELYLGGKNSLKEYVEDENHAAMRYILFGRYLFNGDGKDSNHSWSCNGYAVSGTNKQFEKYSDSWDWGNADVAQFSAYPGSVTSKKTYRVKFGANGLLDNGDDNKEIMPIWADGSKIKCKDLASDSYFSGVTLSSSQSASNAASAVWRYMNVKKITDLPDTSDPGVGITDPNAPGDNTGLAPCWDAGGAVGWIICPVIKGLGGVIGGIYGYIEDNFLAVDADSISSTSPIHKGWSKFRDFANIGFAIAFAVVILSQLTGIGLSNYNIKKMLPRLIAVVILVNISFILCQLAVDLSNILGVSFKKMFDNWATQVPVNNAPADFLDGAGHIASSGKIASVLTLAVVAGGAYAAYLTWEFWLIPLLIALIGIVIGILFFFIVLGVRQAAVLILIVICPVAIVCYALPNTKSLFDKWFGAFKAAILAYPICGLLMGGSRYASNLLISTASTNDAGFAFVLVALLVSVVPFFFIPTLIKSSMTAIGNIGNKVSGFGQRLGSGLGKGIRNTNGVKEMQRQLGMHSDARRYVRFNNRIASREARWERQGTPRTALGRLARRGSELSNRMDRAQRRAAGSSYRRQAAEDAKAEDMLGGLPIPGTAEYEALRAGSLEAGMEESIKNQRARYERGEVLSATGSGTTVQTGNIAGRRDPQTGDRVGMESSLQTEHAALLEQLRNDPEDREARARLFAVQDMMKGTDAGRSALYENFHNAMAANNGSNYTDGQASSLSIAASRLAKDDAFMAKAKSSSHGLHSTINDLNNQQYHAAADANGHNTAESLRQHYGSSRVDKISADSIIGTDDIMREQLLQNAHDGSLGDQRISQVGSAASVALGSERGIPSDVAGDLAQFAMLNFGRGATGGMHNLETGTTGSQALANDRTASPTAMSAISEQINAMQGHNLSAQQRTMLTNFGENITRSLRSGNGNFTPEKAAAFNKTLTSINSALGEERFAQVQPQDIHWAPRGSHIEESSQTEYDRHDNNNSSNTQTDNPPTGEQAPYRTNNPVIRDRRSHPNNNS